MADFNVLKATIASRIPDNTDQLIDAADVRDSLLDSLDEVNAKKQDTLVSGESIKTINHESLLGSGNIVISGGGGSLEWGDITGDIADQTDLKNALDGKQDVISDLSTIQSGAAAGATAVQPGDLAAVATSGDYADLLNTPTIPAAQVNADWNAVSGVAEILNKPAIPAAQVQSDWDESDNTKPAYIKNKPTIPSGVTVDQVYDATSANAQSGVAMAGALAGKEDTISDLSTIRSGAAAGATAVQPGALAAVATSGQYSDLTGTPTIPAAPGTLDTTATTAQATSASEALSESVVLHKVSKTGTYSDLIGTPSLATVATSGSYNDLTDKPTIPTVHNMAAGGTTGQVLAKKSNTDYDTEWVNQSGGGAAVWGSITGDLDDQTDLKNALDAKQDVISNLATIESGAAAGATAVQPGDLATVATSGQYSDLTGTPSLATVATTGDYDDLLNKPTIPAAQVNADWNAGSGVAQILNKPSLAAVATSGDYDDLTNKPTIPTVPTISTDIETDKASNTKTASPKAVADYVEDSVVAVSAPVPNDGTIIFTHRNGDTDTVDLNHVHPQYYSKAAESSQPVGGFVPDVVYVLGELSGSVTFALASAVSGNVNHYFWTFETGASAPTVTWPAGITWLDGSAPTPGASKHCEVSILGGVGVYMEA